MRKNAFVGMMILFFKDDIDEKMLRACAWNS